MHAVFHCDLCDDLRKTAQKNRLHDVTYINMYVGKKGFLSRFTGYLCQYFVFLFSKIIVDGVRGINYRGDAALDDFSFQKGTCNQTGIYRTQERMS